jgi:pimeloyl-ACP methyl ester carboxylesterase
MMRDLVKFPDLAPCVAPLWARDGHSQTLLGHLLPFTAISAAGERVVIPVSDGDMLVGRYFAGETDVVVCREAINSRRRAGLVRERYPIPLFATLQEFDDIYTAPVGGFKNRRDYYESCSTKHRLASIRTPTVIITAKDDPFVGYDDYASAVFGPSVHLHAERVGGHLGYLSAQNTPLGNRRWLDYAVREYLVRLLNG